MNKLKVMVLAVFLVASAVLSGCVSTEETFVATEVSLCTSTDVPTKTPTPTNMPTNTPTPTITPTPTNTLTPTNTPTPTPDVLGLVDEANLTAIGKNLLVLNEKLGEVMGLGEGPFVYNVKSCGAGVSSDLVVSQNPCKELVSIEDKTLDSEKSKFSLMLLGDLFPLDASEFDFENQELISHEVFCGDSRWGPVYGCLSSKAVAVPVTLWGEISQLGCDQAMEGDFSILEKVGFIPSSSDTRNAFNACFLMSKETMEGFRQLGNDFGGFPVIK